MHYSDIQDDIQALFNQYEFEPVELPDESFNHFETMDEIALDRLEIMFPDAESFTMGPDAVQAYQAGKTALVASLETGDPSYFFAAMRDQSTLEPTPGYTGPHSVPNPEAVPECLKVDSSWFGHYCFTMFPCMKKWAAVNGLRGITIGSCEWIPTGCDCRPKDVNPEWIALILAVASIWFAWPGFSAAALRFLAELRARAIALGIG